MEQIQENIKLILKNPYVTGFLKVFLILYASQLAPRLPSVVSNIFSNTFIKIIAVALLAYISELDFQLAILLAIVFVLGNNLFARGNMMESYTTTATKAMNDKQLILQQQLLAAQNAKKQKKSA